jgi:hypothetical protein
MVVEHEDGYMTCPSASTMVLPLTMSSTPGLSSRHPTRTRPPVFKPLMKVAPSPYVLALRTTLPAETVIAVVVLQATASTV